MSEVQPSSATVLADVGKLNGPARPGRPEKSDLCRDGEGRNRTGDTTIFSAERERESLSSEGEVDDGTPANQELRLFDD
jgi:hypothetical protein